MNARSKEGKVIFRIRTRGGPVVQALCPHLTREKKWGTTRLGICPQNVVGTFSRVPNEKSFLSGLRTRQRKRKEHLSARQVPALLGEQRMGFDWQKRKAGAITENAARSHRSRLNFIPGGGRRRWRRWLVERRKGGIDMCKSRV